MPLGAHVKYMSEVIKEEQTLVDDLFWEAMDVEDFILACRRETMLQYLEDLHEQGEEYYVTF